jgi:hypothetical protein
MHDRRGGAGRGSGQRGGGNSMPADPDVDTQHLRSGRAATGRVVPGLPGHTTGAFAGLGGGVGQGGLGASRPAHHGRIPRHANRTGRVRFISAARHQLPQWVSNSVP